MISQFSDHAVFAFLLPSGCLREEHYLIEHLEWDQIVVVDKILHVNCVFSHVINLTHIVLGAIARKHTRMFVELCFDLQDEPAVTARIATPHIK